MLDLQFKILFVMDAIVHFLQGSGRIPFLELSFCFRSFLFCGIHRYFGILIISLFEKIFCLVEKRFTLGNIYSGLVVLFYRFFQSVKRKFYLATPCLFSAFIDMTYDLFSMFDSALKFVSINKFFYFDQTVLDLLDVGQHILVFRENLSRFCESVICISSIFHLDLFKKVCPNILHE